MTFNDDLPFLDAVLGDFTVRLQGQPVISEDGSVSDYYATLYLDVRADGQPSFEMSARCSQSNTRLNPPSAMRMLRTKGFWAYVDLFSTSNPTPEKLTAAESLSRGLLTVARASSRLPHYPYAMVGAGVDAETALLWWQPLMNMSVHPLECVEVCVELAGYGFTPEEAQKWHAALDTFPLHVTADVVRAYEEGGWSREQIASFLGDPLWQEGLLWATVDPEVAILAARAGLTEEETTERLADGALDLDAVRLLAALSPSH